MARCEKTKTIYSLTSKEQFHKDYGLKDQMQRASVSVMSNIAEGYEWHTKKEFAAFLYHAKGSIGELKSQLYVAFDLGYIYFKTTIRTYPLFTKQALRFVHSNLLSAIYYFLI